MTEIAKEYGTALFMLACEENSAEEIHLALEKVNSVFTQNPEYIEFLSSPSISLKERLSAIDIAFGDSLPEHLLSFLKLLCEKARISCYFDSADEYKALFDASRRISNAKVTSAVELTAEEKQKLKSKLEGTCKGEVNLEYFIDESLLGGLVVELDGKILDGSLRHRLSEVKEVISI